MSFDVTTLALAKSYTDQHGGGGASTAGDFIIKMAVASGEDGYTVTSCDATVEQIDAAVAAEKRVVLIATDTASGLFWEMPIIFGSQGNSYEFGTFLEGQVIVSFVDKVGENESKWQFMLTKISAEAVNYSNAALSYVSTVGGALDELVPKSHTHSNKSVLDKFAETDGKPTYDGEAIGGGGGTSDFIIKMTVTSDDDGNYTVTSCDATVEQIDAAVSAEKRAVVIASIDSTILELPMLERAEGNTYYFGIFFNGSMILSSVYKVDGNTSKWEFNATQIEAESVGYSNAALPNISTVGGALDALVPNSHTHANKDTLDKLSDSNGKLQYNGSDVGLKPVKGTDYWTAADKQEIIDDIHPVYYIDLTGTYPNYTCPVAMDDIKAAYNSGYNLVCRCSLGAYTATLPLFVPMPAANTWIFTGSGCLQSMNFEAQSFTVAITANGVVAQNKELVTFGGTLPNPYELQITVGDNEYFYDGSKAVTVDMGGITPTIGANGNWYLGSTDTGKPSRGEKGDKGDTPVKGTDYWTAADKAEIVADTLAALPTWTGGSY